MQVDLSSKTILVTGATSGIGKNTAIHLVKDCSAHAVLVARREDALNALQEELGEHCLPIPCDLQDLHSIHGIFAKLATLQIKLDGLVHCAGLSPMMLVADNDIETMQKTYQVNLFSFIELAKYFQNPEYSNEGSSIVVMSSIAAQYACYRQSIYAGSKAAVEETVRCMAKEFMNRRIRVNSIEAGAVETEMLEKLEAQSDGLKEKLEKIYPLGTISPSHISDMIAYLLSGDACNMTGSSIRMDSGFAIAK